MARTCWLYNWERPIPYPQAWQWQKQMVSARLQDPTLPDAVLMLEHPPVYTLGQGSDLRFLKFALNDPHIPCYRTERGGEVTYHALGQLVVYPIFNLRCHQPDLHWYLRQLEEVVIRTLARCGLRGDRKAGLTGVWIGDKKVAQLGIKVSRWITMHGFAINIDMDMSGFQQIVPCGIADYGCAQLRDFLPSITLPQVKKHCLAALAEVFDLVFTQSPEPVDQSQDQGAKHHPQVSEHRLIDRNGASRC